MSASPALPNDGLPNERTPLISGPGSSETHERVDSLPCLGPVVARFDGSDLSGCTVAELCPYALPLRAQETAFALCVALHLRVLLRTPTKYSRDVYDRYTHEKRDAEALVHVDKLVGQAWRVAPDDFSSTEEIQDILWTAFPWDSDQRNSMRVADYVAREDAPESLLVDRLVLLSVLDMWKHGHRSHEHNEWHLLRRISSLCTPRALYIVELLFHLVYLGFLSYYLIQPFDPFSPKWIATRDIYIAVYSLSRISFKRPLSTMPYIILALLFIFTNPSVPPLSPEHFTYCIAVVVYSWQVVELHLPIQPSPLFLFTPQRALPLAVLVWRSVFRIFLPVITFFLPSLLLAFFLLSLSLTHAGYALPHTLYLPYPPVETRVGFLFLFAILACLLWCSLTMPVLLYPFIATNSAVSTNPWDRYSEQVGMEARRVFVHAVATHSGPMHFPVPLNLVQLLAVRLPRRLLRAAGRPNALQIMGSIEHTTWLVLVAPLALVAAGLWGWGLW